MRVRRRVILQHDTQVIGVSRLLSGSSLPEFNGCPCGGRRRGGSGQIAGDLMDLRRCEAVRFLFLASNEGNGEQKRNPQQRKTRRIPCVDSKAIQDWLNRVTLPDHRKLKQPFSRGPSTGQVLGEKWGLPETGDAVRALVPFESAERELHLSREPTRALYLPRPYPNHLPVRHAPLPSA